jgi:hypothetical protein
LQLTDIAGPIVIQQQLESLLTDIVHAFAQLGGYFLDKMMG